MDNQLLVWSPADGEDVAPTTAIRTTWSFPFVNNDEFIAAFPTYRVDVEDEWLTADATLTGGPGEHFLVSLVPTGSTLWGLDKEEAFSFAMEVVEHIRKARAQVLAKALEAFPWLDKTDAPPHLSMEERDKMNALIREMKYSMQSAFYLLAHSRWETDIPKELQE